MEAFDIVYVKKIKDLVSKGKRDDGRSFTDFRSIKIEKEVIPNAEGSAEVFLGSTRVIAGIKLELETPMEDTPEEGNMVVSADLLPLASSSFELGPPNADAIELSRVVDRAIRSANVVDSSSLFIAEDKVWTIYIDINILDADGNLFDASLLAAMAALQNTKIPKYENGKIIREERIHKLKLDNIVTSTTFAKINGELVLDPTSKEELASDARITIATDGTQIRSMQKGMSGSFSLEEINKAIDISFSKHAELEKALRNAGAHI
ncbi:MAG: exosome complex protein Rrp42 [Candidatus Micrarchaeia archaeon]